MGRVYKPKNSNYFYYDIVDQNGNRKRGSTGVRDKKTAELILAKIEVEVAEGKYFDRREKKSKINFYEMTEKFLEWSKGNKRSWKTDGVCLKHLKNYFGDKPLTEISPFLIEGYKIKRKEIVKPRTVNIELACLKHLFTKAIEWDFAKENPVKKVKLFRENNARLRYLDEDEISRLLNACDVHLRPVVINAIHTGMRRGEILNMKWNDIDFKNGIIFVPHSKNDKPREIPMSNTLRNTLLDLKEKSECEFVFTSKDDKTKPLKDIRNIFDKARKKAKLINFCFHDLRHTFASHLVMNGVDLKTVQELLGHKNFEMTLRYSHLSPAHKREAVKVMDRINGTHLAHFNKVLEIKKE